MTKFQDVSAAPAIANPAYFRTPSTGIALASSIPCMTMSIGTELSNRYRVEESLGEGGMGRVYAASDRQLGRRVAIKVLREPHADAEGRERFMREARAAAALSHPHACALYEVGDHDGQPFLVMELLQGEPLSSRLARERLSVDEVMRIVTPLMSAVTALHEAGLVHRDLKPANVFLTPDGVKLLDFGLARHTEAETAVTAAAITAPGAVTGTLRYMAPEQITGDPVDERTDIFALGVLLYEMLAGRAPFDADTNVDWLNAVLTRQPAPLGGDGLRAFEPVVARALQRRVEDRYRAVRELAAALEAAQAGLAPAPARASSSAAPTPPADHASATDARPSLVVLPFHALREDAELAFLEEGLAEGLTTSLSEQDALRIVSPRAVSQRNGDASLAVIGRELGVQFVLTGTFLRADRRVRVMTQLVATDDGHVQWSHTGEHAFVDALTLHDEIRDEILATLTVDAQSQPGQAASASSSDAASNGACA